MSKRDRLQGTLDLLILKTLTRGPQHGFGITMHIETVTGGALRFQEGSLYPALQRMQNEGCVTAKWKKTENNRRARYYTLTKAGREQLEAERQHWRRVAEAVELVLEYV
jgi:PadR family transcriptional regulator PadR